MRSIGRRLDGRGQQPANIPNVDVGISLRDSPRVADRHCQSPALAIASARKAATSAVHASSAVVQHHEEVHFELTSRCLPAAFVICKLVPTALARAFKSLALLQKWLGDISIYRNNHSPPGSRDGWCSGWHGRELMKARGM